MLLIVSQGMRRPEEKQGRTLANPQNSQNTDNYQSRVSLGSSLRRPQIATTARSKITDLHGDLNNPPHAGTLKYIQMGQGHTKQS